LGFLVDSRKLPVLPFVQGQFHPNPENEVSMSPISTGRNFGVGGFALELEGGLCGLLKSVSGGGASADVVAEKLGSDYLMKKHLSAPKYGDFQIACGAGMSKTFLDWVEASLKGLHIRKNGSITALDFDFKERERREFTNALITEITFPACDGSSKDPAYIAVNFKPEVIRVKQGTNSPKTVRSAQKHWTMNNFRLAIAGIDCSKVSKVAALQINPLTAQAPNLVITLPESHAQPLYNWHNNFVVKGNSHTEKQGTLTYLTPDLKGEIFTLEFHNLGIFKVTADKAEAHNENIRRVRCEMYTERIEFKYSQGSTWA